ncbi:hypothetical protein [Clostridium sp.]|uniref:hypothetical protein n=1 Tax=Clostridium sp. TaxID=1506 RepID=UPI0039F45042
MLMKEFYRQVILKIEKQIKDAESNGDFKNVAALMKEKNEWNKRAEQDGLE